MNFLSPSTGIVDSHALMEYFIARAKSQGVQIAYQTKVVGIEKVSQGYRVIVKDRTGKFSFTTRMLINCAGLYSDKVAELAGIDIAKAGYKLHYCKGEYFSVGRGKSSLVQSLIFPLPPPEVTDVGIHVTFDLDGRMRLGPSTHYVDSIPKLQGPGEDMKDFVIRDESDKGLPGFINLIGIESPGPTASPAIAEYVRGLCGF
jgi:L-2-hydroxyglutarate oxidase LhgO